MQLLSFLVFSIAMLVAIVSGNPSGSGISQQGMHIYRDAAEYHAARAQRQREQQTALYTVQHPKNPTLGASQTQPAWKQAQTNYRPPTQQPYRHFAQQTQQPYRQQPAQRTQQPYRPAPVQTQQNNYYGNSRRFQNTPTPKPLEYVEANFKVIRNLNRLNQNHRFSSPHWSRARETTDEMRQSLNLIEALDPSQPLKYY